MTMASQPRLVLLDEPMAGMSQQEVTYTTQLISELTENCTLLIVEHDMNVVRPRGPHHGPGVRKGAGYRHAGTDPCRRESARGLPGRGVILILLEKLSQF